MALNGVDPFEYLLEDGEFRRLMYEVIVARVHEIRATERADLARKIVNDLAKALKT